MPLLKLLSKVRQNRIWILAMSGKIVQWITWQWRKVNVHEHADVGFRFTPHYRWYAHMSRWWLRESINIRHHKWQWWSRMWCANGCGHLVRHKWSVVVWRMRQWIAEWWIAQMRFECFSEIGGAFWSMAILMVRTWLLTADLRWKWLRTLLLITFGNQARFEIG